MSNLEWFLNYIYSIAVFSLVARLLILRRDYIRWINLLTDVDVSSIAMLKWYAVLVGGG